MQGHVEIPEFVKALQKAFDLVPIQVRDPSYNMPSFWSTALNITRARPIPVGPGWVDFLEIPQLSGHAKILEKYITACQTLGAVQFRWIVNGILMDATQVIVAAGVDQHLNRALAAPYPCTYRHRPMRFGSEHPVRIQALNTTANIQVAFAAVQGWYYPTLGSTNEVTRGEGVNDVARSF